ncbi:hypothetical protein QBC46DRAFT_422863 [Diplogelasinospora grovesii]|uniref:Tat pathway signal sequence n=1 Tax=Diplogelasinospora grovesii TaxID=303347 RepID=A0AAN6MZ03_9PEZI|nr:hypothetical protein QBC46DRAFT_422863 [Diplogelasinospora grovesii]
MDKVRYTHLDCRDASHQQDNPEATPLASDRSSEDAAEEEYYFLSRRKKTLHRSHQSRWTVYISLLTVANLVCATISLYVFLGHQRIDLDAACAEHTTQYSPVLRDAKVKYAFTSFNGSFLQQDIYRLPGSVEVDAAWEALGVDYRAGVISTDEGLKSGLTPAHVQRADKYGGGFFVNVEGLHHLHCLESTVLQLRDYKALGTHAFKNDDHILQLHVSHCLDTVRQVLMCNADTGVLGQVWADRKHPAAFPDFNTRHKCKNYDDIRRWGEVRQEPPPDTLPNDYLKWPGPGDVLEVTP